MTHTGVVVGGAHGLLSLLPTYLYLVSSNKQQA